MERWLGKYSEWIYGIARIVVGLLFAAHGAQKLFGGPDGPPQTASALMMFAGAIELVCGLLIAVGFWTGYAAFIASGQMAVAYFVAHAPNGFSPLANKGELAVVYCFLFLFIASKGAGRKLSLEAAFPRIFAQDYRRLEYHRR
jgi:putative oxidoreductase